MDCCPFWTSFLSTSTAVCLSVWQEGCLFFGETSERQGWLIDVLLAAGSSSI
ncbi:hypothetical protein KC19_1G170500 [Ceratodon purpureus]|uniref:Uncharacterized protein n=1 Tax=Ceratodon purpureus TaxID=3225 RepID=A0A8T0J746_CERPU|nr:hypothetical protein KC19_1G170500 [Ceratodon purpureus]